MKRPFPENRDAVSAGFIRLLFNRGTRVLHAFLATFLSLKESSPCNEATLSLLPSSCISNTEIRIQILMKVSLLIGRAVTSGFKR